MRVLIGAASSSGPQAPVTFVTGQLEPRSGMELAVIQLTRSLSKSRDVQLIIVSGGSSESPVPTYSLGIGRRPTRLLQAVVPLRKALANGDPRGVVVAVGLWAALPVLIAAPRRARVIVWEHSLSAWRVRFDARVRLLARVARVLYRRARTIVTVSESARAFTSLCFPTVDVLCIPNEVLDPQNHLSQTRPSHVVACVGSLNKRKNVSLALRAVALLRDRGLELVVAGDGELRAALEREAEDMGIADRVTFLGHVTSADSVYQRASVILHPALDETFGFALVEAAQHQRPVVVLDLPNMNRLVPEFAPGVVVSEQTPEAFAEGIQLALEQKWSPRAFESATEARSAVFGASQVRNQGNELIDRVAKSER